MDAKIDHLLGRLVVLEEELGDPDVFSDQKKYKQLTQEHTYLSQLQGVTLEWRKAQTDLEEHLLLLRDEKDPEMLALLKEEIAQLEALLPRLETQVRQLLLPPDPNDNRNTILELRAGTGGDEAALFVGDCVRMYQLYAGKKGWSVEMLSATPSEAGGFKEYIMVFSGRGVYRSLRYEGGTHRVQRIPLTETQGRVHTSAITVAILLEPDEEEPIQIDESDLRIKTFRASGAGGQHVNVTDSAVDILHEPSGIRVSCQDERSQHKNKAKALRVLQAKLLEHQQREKQQAVAKERASQVGSGDRSERIRTYNFPQNRVTDHRIKLTHYNLNEVMEGELDSLTEPLILHYREERLNSL